MHRIFLSGIVFFALSSFSLGAAAQKMKIESQGQAEQEAQKATAIAKSMEQSVGAPAAGMGQVVFFRSSKSPGEPIGLTADGTSAGDLDAGMYLALPATPGTHPYGPGTLPVTVKAGEIHALVGENGAGKSTLMKVLSGVYPHGTYSGEIVYEGEARRFSGIADSEKLGIIIIHQELALVPLLSIAENIFLSHAPSRFGVIDRDAVYRRTQELLAQVGLRESPDALITDLGVGKQQLVEIAKALSKRVRLLILDEPTASLNEADSAALLDRLIAFREQGIASILISHKLNEVARVADRITVLRDGRTVDHIDCRTASVDCSFAFARASTRAPIAPTTFWVDSSVRRAIAS